MSGEPIDVADRLSLRTRPPGLSIMRQHWGSLLFMHWPVPAELLRPLIPEPLSIDTHDGLKLSLALLYERRDECPGAVPILTVHDEIVVECDEDRVKGVEAWLKKAMIDGMEAVLNAPGLGRSGVPVEVEARRSRTWE